MTEGLVQFVHAKFNADEHEVVMITSLAPPELPAELHGCRIPLGPGPPTSPRSPRVALRVRLGFDSAAVTTWGGVPGF